MSWEGLLSLLGGLLLGGVCGLWVGRLSMLKQLRLMSQLARVDVLTGLLNRRAFEEHLTKLEAVALRYGQLYSLILIDLDHFKSLNDEAGHPAGDAALREIAATLRDQIRDADRVFRVGGDEFAVLCPCTGAEGATVLAERLRAAVTALRIHNVRFSAGIAANGVSPEAGDLLNVDIMKRADMALMISKRAGGNQVRALIDHSTVGSDTDLPQ